MIMKTIVQATGRKIEKKQSENISEFSLHRMNCLFELKHLVKIIFMFFVDMP